MCAHRFAATKLMRPKEKLNDDVVVVLAGVAFVGGTDAGDANEILDIGCISVACLELFDAAFVAVVALRALWFCFAINQSPLTF